MALKTFTCEHCGKEFEDKDCRNRRFCSLECDDKRRKSKMVNLTCEYCNKLFRRRYHKNRTPRFCSYECSALGRPPRPKNYKPIACIVCGTIKLDRSGATRKFCSYKCKGIWLTVHTTGEKNPNWKPETAEYYGPNWRQQRREARKRDSYQCQHCGISEKKHGRQLDVHHIKPFVEFGYMSGKNDNYVEANDLSNLICLCKSCHKLAEHSKIPLQLSLPF